MVGGVLAWAGGLDVCDAGLAGVLAFSQTSCIIVVINVDNIELCDIINIVP